MVRGINQNSPWIIEIHSSLKSTQVSTRWGELVTIY